VLSSQIAASLLSVVGRPSLNYTVSTSPLAVAADRFLGKLQSDISNVTALFSSVAGMAAISATRLHPAVVLAWIRLVLQIFYQSGALSGNAGLHYQNSILQNALATITIDDYTSL
jgi:hypothetical protein